MSRRPIIEAGPSLNFFSIRLISTLTVLERAAGGQHIPDRGSMRSLYARLRGLDDGLPPIETTKLLISDVWSNA